MISSNLPSAVELVEAFRAGTLSPVEATENALAQIAKHNDKVNAFCLIDGEAALASAKESEQRWANGQPLGPVDGVPTTIKDVVAMQGLPNRRGSAITDSAPANFDAPAVSRLRESGAVFLGKTTSPEFGWKGVTDNVTDGITRNPWNLDLTPGGSSGGSAAALAAGMGTLSIGSDGGGSVRIPASFCGVAALKPTFGRVACFPGSAFESLPIHGPMARSVEDLALLMDIVGRFDSRDPASLPTPSSSFSSGLLEGRDLSDLRIAYSPDLGYANVDPEIAEIVETAVAAFKELGATVETTRPDIQDPIDAFHTLWFTAAAKIVDSMPREMLNDLDPGLKVLAEQSKDISAIEYLKAMSVRYDLASATAVFHDRYHLLVTPTMPIEPFEAGVEVPAGTQLDRWTRWTPFTYPFNMTQQPALSIPCGLTRKGLPVGLQIVGPRFSDHTVLRAGRAFEKARGGFRELAARVPQSTGSPV